MCSQHNMKQAPATVCMSERRLSAKSSAAKTMSLSPFESVLHQGLCKLQTSTAANTTVESSLTSTLRTFKLDTSYSQCLQALSTMSQLYKSRQAKTRQKYDRHMHHSSWYYIHLLQVSDGRTLLALTHDCILVLTGEKDMQQKSSRSIGNIVV